MHLGPILVIGESPVLSRWSSAAVVQLDQVCLGVDHVAIENGGDQRLVIGEEQKQILQRFAGPEALLKVQRLHVVLVRYVVDRCVAAVLDPTELDPGVQNLSALLPVDLLLRHVVQVEQRLDVFRSKQIVAVVRVDVQLRV